MTTPSTTDAPRRGLLAQEQTAPRTPVEPPTLAPGVELHGPATEGEAWFLRRGTHQYFKLTDDLARLVDLVDGSRTRESMLAVLGEPWTAQDIDRALQSLGDAHVLRVEGDRSRPRREILRYVPPFTLQLTLLNPSTLLQRVASWTPFARTRASTVIAVSVMVAGILSLLLRPAEVVTALSTPVPSATVLAIFLGTLAATAVHELGHGLVLASYGGRPRRIGIMLFYLMPAFFCDVSDGWRLSQSRQRVHVALAGILVQGAIGGAAALASALTPWPDLTVGLMIFAIVTLIACLMNTIPFVKLDGYIALMSWLDLPHLRTKAMADARGVLALVLFGRRPPRELPRMWWAVPFGFACMLFPVLLVTNALLIWFDTLQRLGILGSMLIVAVLALAISGVVKEVVATVRAARDAGAGRARIAVAVGACTVAATTALAVIPVPETVAGGFIRTADSLELILPTTSDATQLPPGTPVQLGRSGIVLTVPLGSAVVGGGEPTSALRPFSTLFPVSEARPLIPTTVLPLIAADPITADQGAAFVRLNDQPLWEWLANRLTSGL